MSVKQKHNIKTFPRLFVVALLLVVSGLFLMSRQSVHAANPQLISFQGKVVNADGTNVTNGAYNFDFILWDHPTAGTNRWQELTKSITVTDGVFQTYLGSATALPDFNTYPTLYLAVRFNADAAGYMSPRVQLASVPYALNSDTLGGIAASGFANAGLSNLSSVAINTALLPGADNTIDLGSSAFSFRTLYADTSALTPLLDRASAGTLSIGTGGASAATTINVGSASVTSMTFTTDNNAANDFSFTGGATFSNGVTFSSTTIFNGLSTFNTDSDFTFAGTENINVTNTTGSNAVDLLALTITNNDAGSAAQRGIVITNADSSSVTETGITIDNADTTASSLTDAILITSSGVNNGVVDAIDVSAANIQTALRINANAIEATELDFNIAPTGSTSSISIATDAAAEDFFLEVTGATDSSLVLRSSGTGADALQILASAGGVTLDAITALSIDVTAATAASNISVVANADAEDLTIAVTGSAGDLFINSADQLTLDAGSATSIVLADLITDANAVLYTTTAGVLSRVVETETGSQCLLSGAGASGIPVWGSCGSYANQQLSNLSGTVAINLSLLPASDDAIDLGDNTHRFRDLFLAGDTLHLGTSTTDEGTLSYNTTTNIFHIGTDSTTNADIAFFTDDLYLDKSNGNVGIGVQAPNTTLQVQGATAYGIARFTTSDYADGTAGSGLLVDTGATTGNTYTRLSAYSAGFSVWNDLALQSGGGEVGIGTTNPGAKLDVNGAVIISGNATLTGYAGANAVLYSAPTTGLVTTATTTTGSQCLTSGSGASGVPVWGACGGGGATLDSAYTAGNTIGTDSGSNVIINLADVATPTEVTINNLDASGTNGLQIDNSTTLTNGLFIEQSAAGTLSNGIQIAGTAGTITSGLTIADGAGAITTGITLSGTFTNLLDSPNFDVSNAGAITTTVASGASSLTNTTSGSGLVLSGTNGAVTTSLRIVNNTNAWADAVTSSYFQATNTTNNHLTFMGGAFGTDTQLTRVQFASLLSQFTDTTFTATPVPTALFELISGTASKVELFVNGGATDRTVDVAQFDVDVNSASVDGLYIDLDVGTALSAAEQVTGINIDVTGLGTDDGTSLLYGINLNGDVASTGVVKALNLSGSFDTGLDLSGAATTTDITLDDGLTISQTSDNDLDLVENSLTLNTDFGETTASTITTSSASAMTYSSGGLLTLDAGNATSVVLTDYITDANAVLYSSTTGVLTRVAETETAGQCLTSGAGAGGVPVWGSCGGGGSDLDTVYTADSDKTMTVNNGSGLSFNFTTAGLFSVKDNGLAGLAFDTNDSHLKIYENTGTPTNYLDLYYDNATSSAIIAASSGTTKVGSGSGPINITAGSGAAITITGNAASVWSTTAGNLTIGAGGTGDLIFLLDSDSPAVFSGGTTDITTGTNEALTIAPDGTGDVIFTIDDDSNVQFNDSMTNTGSALDINTVLVGDADVDTISALNIDVTSAATGDADVLYGINIANLTSPDATVIETGLRIGTGWNTAIEANGNVLIGARSDSTASSFSITNSAAGTFGADGTIAGATSSAIYKGKLFVGTSKTDAAGVYRYDGGTTWTLVTNAVGKVQSADAANIDSYSLTVFNNQLVIGSKGGASVAGVYTSTNADTGTAGTTTWTLLNTTRGQFATGCLTVACPTVIDGVDDMAVFNGQLYIITQETNAMEVYRYNGGTGASVFFRVSGAQPGEILVADATDGDGGVLQAYGGKLYVGVKTGSTTGRVFFYSGAVADDLAWTLVNTTRGTFTAGTTGEPDVTSMTVYNGALWVTTAKANAANIYMLKGGFTALGGASPFQKMTTTNGKIISGDTANIDSILLKVYQGRLYAGSSTGAGTNLGAIYEYDTSLAAADNFTLIGTRGTLGSETTVDDITLMQPMNIVNNGALFYVGTNDSGNTGAVYSWYKYLSQSQALRLDSGSSNFGSLIFTADDQAYDNNARLGKFIFSHSVNLSAGAFDYAEDYPTLDESLVPGEPVSVDPRHPEHVKRATKGETVLGVVSENPGFSLSSTVQPTTGARWIPIALVGRVPVLVTTHEGTAPILPGDTLAISDIPGVLEKATASSGAVVGTALAGYDSPDIGKISLYVNPGLKGIAGGIDASQISELIEMGYKGKPFTLMPSDTAEAGAFSIQDENGQDMISFDNQGNAYFAGTLTADKIKASHIEGLEILTDKISSLSAAVAASEQSRNTTEVLGEQTEPQSESESTGNNIDMSDVTFQTAKVTLDLKVFGTFTASGALVVDGDATFNGLVEFAGRATFNNDTGGFATILAGQKEVEVKFDKAYDTSPSISATIKNGAFAAYSYNEIKNELNKVTGFKILLKEVAEEDVEFSWLAISIKDARSDSSETTLQTN